MSHLPIPGHDGEGQAARSHGRALRAGGRSALHFIDERRGHENDPLVALLDEAPFDDEPTTPEENAGATEARDEYKRSVFFESDEIKRELG